MNFAAQGELTLSRARFDEACLDPRRAQEARLRAFLRTNSASAYGRAHSFGAISTVAEYQRRVPIVDYDALEPWVARIARGEPSVLTEAPVLMFELSGGSTSVSKYVPYTQALFDEFKAATGPWLHDLFSDQPRLRQARQYWSISPAVPPRPPTAGGIAIGIDDDTAYLSSDARAAVGQLMAVPGSVRHITDAEAWRRTTLTALLAADDLGFISVWSPSFLTVLMEALKTDLDHLLASLSVARANAIREGLERDGRLVGERVWPHLQLISCWADGPAAAQLVWLRRHFPSVAIQPKGLLATEGVVSIPLRALGDRGSVLAVNSHFLEFLDVQTNASQPLLAHELREGAEYTIVLTTGGGFARYHLKDVVRVVGRHGATPAVRFMGKLDSVSDLVGEKISNAQVTEGLKRGCEQLGVQLRFALLAPCSGERPGYVLYAEPEHRNDLPMLPAIAAELDGYLAQGHGYGYAKRLGQLGPVRVVAVSDGWRRYVASRSSLGGKLGEVKPTSLDARFDGSTVFGTSFLS